MKRIILFALIFAMLLPCLFGCAQNKIDEKINIVCTIFPLYDWVKSIVGDSDKVEVSLLIQNGSDPHSYQPTASDIVTISNCDMIVYIGAESDVWVSDALARANNEDTKKVAVSHIKGLTLHNISSASHSHGEHSGHHHGDNDNAFDEHLWLSLKNAAAATEYLSEKICELDSDNADIYKRNAGQYKNKLLDLDRRYAQAIESVSDSHPFILFADRFPFVYLLEDYGVDYAAAFEGCTTDVDAGFDTVLRLIKEADSHKISHIAVTESSDKALARTVADSARGDIEIVVMNSLQSVTAKQLSKGYSYLSEMENNLKAMKIALDIKGE